MSELRSAIESLRVDSLADLPDARIEEDFAELQHAMDRLEAERLRRLAEIDRRRIFARDGHLSTASWLAAAFRVAWGTARDSVRMARALDEMPKTKGALCQGEISVSAARVLTSARDVDRAAFRRSERHLVEAARAHTPRDLQRVAAHWRALVEREHADGGGGRRRERRYLHASVSFLGMVRVDGDLDAETGETLLTALRAVLDDEAKSGTAQDLRSPAQRRADALGEICRQWLDRGDRPQVGGEHPHVSLTVGVDVLSGRGLDTCELDHTGIVDAETARRLTCDASISRVVMSGRSEPLDVGRRTQVVPPAMRRAVVVRDEHCRFPGCDRPQSWCDAHHVVHWARGGATALPNLLLLCRRHHRMVHERGGFALELLYGRAVFRRPDGSIIGGDGRGPP